LDPIRGERANEDIVETPESPISIHTPTRGATNQTRKILALMDEAKEKVKALLKK
jgi:predicted metal-dependent TIM-barrel fold hydrolase